MKNSTFDEIAPSYNLKTRLSSDCIQSIIHSFLEQITPKLSSHLVDVGGGSGHFTSEFLCQNFIKECSIIDISRPMLKRALKHINNANVVQQLNLIQGDAERIPLKPEISNLVLMSFVIHLLKNPQTALLEIRRILSPYGKFFLVTYD